MRHEDFYSFVASKLTNAREHRSLSKSQLAKMVGEQYNTIAGIEQGRRFSAHHIVWIDTFLGSKVSEDFLNQGDSCGEEESRLEDFI